MIKKPVFSVYMRMQTDEAFRKDYIAHNKINSMMSETPKAVKRTNRKSISPKKRKFKDKRPSVQNSTPPLELPPICMKGCVKKKHMRLTARTRNRTLDRSGKGKESLRAWDVEDEHILHKFHNNSMNELTSLYHN